jgi:phosphate acyltransferase
MVRDSEADAFVSAGNTIACLASAIFDLRRIRGVRRPALCTVYPITFDPMVFLDMGATADATPEILMQNARMGVVYAEKVLGIPNPRVGLLANGEEEEKGTMVLREAFPALKASDLNFVGNVEPKEVVRGYADVVVTDGFTGNIHIKTAEAVASFLKQMIRRDVVGPVSSKVGLVLMIPGLLLSLPGLLLLLPGLRRLVKRLDYAEVGGGLLLGVNGVVIVGHGRSNAKAVKFAVLRAREAVAAGVVAAIGQGIAS